MTVTYDIIDETRCPNCQSSLLGDEIPELERENFDGKKHYSRRLVRISTGNKGDLTYICPDCNHEWT